MPSTLSPFLTPAFFFEVVVVVLVFQYILRTYFGQRNSLDGFAVALENEDKALVVAKSTMRTADEQRLVPARRVELLKGSLTPDTLVQKRVLLIERNASRLPETTLSRSIGQATDEARFWTGAFTFIGLCGTLLCLGVAVFYLMLIVGRSGTGTNLTSGLKEVVAHMVAVFGSMGAAFLSTATGVGATVKLGGKIAQVEREWEDLRTGLEEFSLMELEPLSQTLRVSQQDDFTPLATIVGRMETITGQFTSALTKAVETVQTLNNANDDLSVKLRGAAERLDGATQGFATTAQNLDGKLSSLTTAIERQEEVQSERNQAAGRALTMLQETTKGALDTFQKLDTLREDIAQDTAVTRSEMRESLQSIQHLAQTIGGTSQQALYQLRDDINRGLQLIKDSIDAGTQSEERLLRQFELILGQVGEYASHVEDTIKQLPGAIGTEPLLLLENGQSEALGRLGEGVSHVRGEISGLRGDIRESFSNVLRESQGGGGGRISDVGAKVDAIDNQFRAVTANTEGLPNTMAALSSQITTLDGQIRQINLMVSRLDRGFVFRIGRG